ncbi:unnamed protein product [Medioppia subpectinata]|uniref:C2H2-type domain-containing protein n=1 Tax=Medioppia subpectinata TaxID=1979941 RepID=A0A7R9L444_9ACAR|nr:unnamed protein product [Medioppia subpectinata]CAG2113960.1 unnamed protein product [Medioppia subpectinata]
MKIFTYNTNLIRHKNNIHLNVKFVCDFNECNKSFKRNDNLLVHKNTVHSNVDKKQIFIHCFWPKCQYKTLDKSNLNRHQLNHSNNTIQLKQHKNVSHLNVRFICDFNECHKSFTLKDSLIKHKSYVHLNERKFKCNENNCGKKFNTKYNLINHMRLHSGNKPYVCDFNECYKSFTTKYHLFEHKSCVHLNEKRFKCNEENCGQKFNYKSVLNLHKRIHLGEKPFVCDINNCNKAIKPSSLWHHKNRFHLNI